MALRKFHCANCGVEKELEELRIPQEGIHLRKCPKCGALMKAGALPSPPPNRKELSKLRKTLDAVWAAIAAQRPQTIEAERLKLAQLREEIAKLKAQSPQADAQALLRDAEAEAAKMAQEIAEKERKLTVLKAQAEELEGKLRILEEADRYHRQKALETKLSQPWPGETELVELLRKWRDKFGPKLEAEVEQFREEARAIGWFPPRQPPSLWELIQRAWSKLQKS